MCSTQDALDLAAWLFQQGARGSSVAAAVGLVSLYLYLI
jgi:hypothetical protein